MASLLHFLTQTIRIERFSFLVVAFLLASCTVAEPAASSKVSATFEEAASDRKNAGELNGIVLVTRGETVVFRDAFGLANATSGRELTADTKSRVASVTKQFTAAAILLLAEEGRLSLDDTIGSHLPNYPAPQADRITIRQMLNHSSGLPRPERKSAQETPQTSTQDRLEVFASLPLDFEPGSKHAYSNSGYIVLGAIIEKVTGESFPVALEALLFDPIGLRNTRAAFDDTIIPDLASDVRRSNGRLVEDDYRISDRGAPFSAGMLTSTVDDLAKWTRTLHKGEVFENPDSYRLMLATPGGWEENRAFDQWAYASGLFHARRDNGREFIFHDGRLGSYLADLRYYPALDVTVVVLETAGGDVTGTADALEDVAFELFGPIDQ